MVGNGERSIFTKIVARELPAMILFENDRVIALEPLEKLAPVHILVVPKNDRYQNVVELAAADPVLLAEIVEVSKAMATEHSNGEFRLVFNTGASTGQTVFHVHAHVLSGDLPEGTLA
jgi:histidine triad (HIT) family protein